MIIIPILLLTHIWRTNPEKVNIDSFLHITLGYFLSSDTYALRQIGQIVGLFFKKNLSLLARHSRRQNRLMIYWSLLFKSISTGADNVHHIFLYFVASSNLWPFNVVLLSIRLNLLSRLLVAFFCFSYHQYSIPSEYLLLQVFLFIKVIQIFQLSLLGY